MGKKLTTNAQTINKRARFEYHIGDTYIAGIQLVGMEAHFIRRGRLTLTDAFCYFVDNELFLKDSTVSGMENDSIKRDRKLLLKRKELNKISKSIDKGTTVIPLRVFDQKGLFKCEIAIAKGKKNYDKRETIKDRDIKRETDRELKK
jgi:SsrA-binding protein